jgi:hypothetical protein
MGTEQNRDRHDELHCSFDRRSTGQCLGIFIIQQKTNVSRRNPTRNRCSHEFFRLNVEVLLHKLDVIVGNG